MKSVMKILLLSCKKATLYIEKSHEKPLSFIEKLQLHFHLKMCDKCLEYRKQSFIIEKALKSHQKKVIDPSHLTLSENFKTLIQNKIDSNLKKG